MSFLALQESGVAVRSQCYLTSAFEQLCDEVKQQTVKNTSYQLRKNIIGPRHEMYHHLSSDGYQNENTHSNKVTNQPATACWLPFDNNCRRCFSPCAPIPPFRSILRNTSHVIHHLNLSSGESAQYSLSSNILTADCGHAIVIGCRCSYRVHLCRGSEFTPTAAPSVVNRVVAVGRGRCVVGIHTLKKVGLLNTIVMFARPLDWFFSLL